MSEFLPGPRWRETAPAPHRWAAIGITIALIIMIGLVVVAALTWTLHWFGAPSWTPVIGWIAAAATLVPWALRAPLPATASDYEAQPWTEYAIRSVMVGVERARPLPARLAAIAVLGPPLLGYGLVFGVLSVIGVV